MKPGLVILVAGESSRLGQPKQLLALGDKTLLQHAVDTARSLAGSPVAVVLGAHAERIRPALDPAHEKFTPRFRFVNPRPISPEEDELAVNPRARSARLRFAERTDAPASG